MDQATPKIFAYSLVLPIVWLSASYLITHVFSDVELGGILATVLIVYISLSTICWQFTRKFNRDFSRKEKIRLTIYFLVWSSLIRLISIYGASEKISSDALLIAFGVVFAIDCLIIISTVFSASKRINGFFLRKYAMKNA